MSRIIVIAGPQGAGKSTVITKLSHQLSTVAALFPGQKAPLFFPLQESRQIVVHKHMLLGAIFMGKQHEQEIVACDLERMDVMLERAFKNVIYREVVYLDECNVFTIAHALAHGAVELQQHWDEYVTRLAKLNAAVIFLDVPPNVSWDRRRARYEQRLVYFPSEQHEGILQKYRNYLVKLHPLLLDVYQRLPFPKVMVDGCCPEDNVIRTVCQNMAGWITSPG